MTRFQKYLKNFKGQPSIERVFNEAYEMGRRDAINDMAVEMHPKVEVITLLKADHRRDVYEGASSSSPRKGSGRYYITYCPGFGGMTIDAVNELVRDGWLTKNPECEGMYLRGPKLLRVA